MHQLTLQYSLVCLATLNNSAPFPVQYELVYYFAHLPSNNYGKAKVKRAAIVQCKVSELGMSKMTTEVKCTLYSFLLLKAYVALQPTFLTDPV